MDNQPYPTELAAAFLDNLHDGGKGGAKLCQYALNLSHLVAMCLSASVSKNSDYVGHCAGQVQAYQLCLERFSPLLERQLHPQIMAILHTGIEATRFGGWQLSGFHPAARSIMLALGLELTLVNLMLKSINLNVEQFLNEGNLDAKFLREAFHMPRPTPAEFQEEEGDDLPF